MGSDVRLCGPKSLWPPEEVQNVAKQLAKSSGANLTITEDPEEALPGAEFVHTDVWVSMGESKDVWTERVQQLAPYQVNNQTMERTRNQKARFMHCLPAFHNADTAVGREIIEHTGMEGGLEVTDSVFNSPANIAFDQAENRLHTIKSVLVATLA